MSDKKSVVSIKKKIERHGLITLLMDDKGKTHALPGLAQMIGVYDSAATVDELADDMIFMEQIR